MPNTDHVNTRSDGLDPPDNRGGQRPEDSEAAGRARETIESFHVFLQDWIAGKLANDDDVFQRGFVRQFEPGFVLVAPSGQLQPIAQLTRMIRAAYGTNPAFEIEIRNVVLRRDLGDTFLVTYEEWQRNAKNSTPPDNARISTVLLKNDRVAPTGLAWLHLHECWLPRE